MAPEALQPMAKVQASPRHQRTGSANCQGDGQRREVGRAQSEGRQQIVDAECKRQKDQHPRCPKPLRGVTIAYGERKETRAAEQSDPSLKWIDMGGESLQYKLSEEDSRQRC